MTKIQTVASSSEFWVALITAIAQVLVSNGIIPESLWKAYGPAAVQWAVMYVGARIISKGAKKIVAVQAANSAAKAAAKTEEVAK